MIKDTTEFQERIKNGRYDSISAYCQRYNAVNAPQTNIPLDYNISYPVSDTDFIVKAIFDKKSPYLRSLCDYRYYGEFIIVKYLKKLREEFAIYDIRNMVVMNWAFKRIRNSQIKLNQLRMKYHFFKPLEF